MPYSVPYLSNIPTTGFVWDTLLHLWERRSGHTLAECLHWDWWAYLLAPSWELQELPHPAQSSVKALRVSGMWGRGWGQHSRQ